jgi:methylenetetrahydrofolate--tRNA-(uracil-5-)-methyltransferase
MNINFGLMPPVEGRWKRADRKKAYTDRARASFGLWLEALRAREPA